MDLDMTNELIKQLTESFVEHIEKEGLLNVSKFLVKANDGEMIYEGLVDLYNDNLEINKSINNQNTDDLNISIDSEEEKNNPVVEDTQEIIEEPIIEESAIQEEIPSAEISTELDVPAAIEEVPVISDDEWKKFGEELDALINTNDEDLNNLNVQSPVSEVSTELDVPVATEEIKENSETKVVDEPTVQEEIPVIEENIVENVNEQEQIDIKEPIKVKVVRRNKLYAVPDKKQIKVKLAKKEEVQDDTSLFRSDLDDIPVVELPEEKTNETSSSEIIEEFKPADIKTPDELFGMPSAQEDVTLSTFDNDDLLEVNPSYVDNKTSSTEDEFTEAISGVVEEFKDGEAKTEQQNEFDGEISDLVESFSTPDEIKSLDDLNTELDTAFKKVDEEINTELDFEKIIGSTPASSNIETPIFNNNDVSLKSKLQSKLKKVVSRKIVTVDKSKLKEKTIIGVLAIKCGSVKNKFITLANKLVSLGNKKELTEEEKIEFMKLNNDIGNDVTLSTQEKSVLLKHMTNAWNKIRSSESRVRSMGNKGE